MLTALCAGALGLWVIQGEARTLEIHGSSPTARVLALDGRETDIGLATQSQKAFLLDCAATLSNIISPDVMSLTNEQRNRLAPVCSAVAQHAIAVSPTNSFAYFVQALSSAVSGDVDLYNKSLHLSYLTGPSEQWIGAWRVDLTESMAGQTDPALSGFHDHDISMMIKGFLGVELIAARFVNDENFRARVTRILDSIPPDRAERFLSYVRRQIG